MKAKIFIFLYILSIIIISCGPTSAYESTNLPAHVQPTVIQPTNTPPQNLPLIETEHSEYPPVSIYVSPLGSDDDDGRSRGQAFASVKHALESAQRGDVVLILEGIYIAW